MTAKDTVTVRVVGGLVELRCVCGLQLQRALRDAIAERCPKCGRAWR